MPKAKFEFTLPEEQDSFEIYCNAGSFHSALSDIAAMFKTHKPKNGITNEALMEFERLRSRFMEILDDNQIKLF